MPADAVKVHAEAARASLGKARTQFPKAMVRADRRAASLAAERSRAIFASRQGVAPKVAESVVAMAATLQFGGPNYPYAMGANFGSHRFKQFPAPADGGGDYAFFAAIEQTAGQRNALYEHYVDQVLDEAFGDQR